MGKINTLLFDLDGTLIDTNEIIIKSYLHAFQKHLPDVIINRQTIIDHIGPTLEQTFSLYTNDLCTVQTLIETYRTYYSAHEHEYFSLYPEVIETLEKLSNMGLNLAIVTSKFKTAAWPSFVHFGLDRYFDVFVSLDDVTHPKPDAEPVLKALSQFSNVESAIMIGDNHGDILSGINAGILSAGVAWSIKGENHLRQVSPNIIFASMASILEWVKKINKEG